MRSCGLLDFSPTGMCKFFFLLTLQEFALLACCNSEKLHMLVSNSVQCKATCFLRLIKVANFS